MLKLDCEGCEYGVLKQLACPNNDGQSDSQMIEQLMVEFHFQKNLGMASDSDLIVAADAITCLENERWGIVSMEKRGCGENDGEYTPSALKVIKEPLFLLFLTLRRVPISEKLSWELYHDIVEALEPISCLSIGSTTPSMALMCWIGRMDQGVRMRWHGQLYSRQTTNTNLCLIIEKLYLIIMIHFQNNSIKKEH